MPRVRSLAHPVKGGLMLRRKRCSVCQKWFLPYQRAYRRQKICSKEPCRKQHHQRAQQQWLRQNPDYFKGSYTRVKLWLAQHPGYLAKYRRLHPDYVDRNRKDQRRRRSIKKQNLVDIQDVVRRHFDGLPDFLIQFSRGYARTDGASEPALLP